MKSNHKKYLLALVEGAMMLALAWVIDYICALAPYNAILFPAGGSITIGKNCFIGVIFGGNRIKKIKWNRTVIVNFFCVIHLSNQCYIFG